MTGLPFFESHSIVAKDSFVLPEGVVVRAGPAQLFSEGTFAPTTDIPVDVQLRIDRAALAIALGTPAVPSTKPYRSFADVANALRARNR